MKDLIVIIESNKCIQIVSKLNFHILGQGLIHFCKWEMNCLFCLLKLTMQISNVIIQ